MGKKTNDKKGGTFYCFEFDHRYLFPKINYCFFFESIARRKVNQEETNKRNTDERD